MYEYPHEFMHKPKFYRESGYERFLDGATGGKWREAEDDREAVTQL